MKSNIPVRPHMESIGKDLQVDSKRSRKDEPGNQSRAQGSAEDWDHGTRGQRRGHDLISAWEEEERRVGSIQERSERRRLERQRHAEDTGERTGEKEREDEELIFEDKQTLTRKEEGATDGGETDANKDDVATEGEIQEEEGQKAKGVTQPGKPSQAEIDEHE